MPWFITHVRRHSMRGMAMIVAPLLSNDQFLCSSASLAFVSNARAADTFLSNLASSSLVVLGGGGGVGATPLGAMSSDSCCSVYAAHSGTSARWFASQPIVPDLSCGFQENLAVGTRSSVLRVLAISASNSGSRASFSAINPPKWLGHNAGKCRRRKSESQEAHQSPSRLRRRSGEAKPCRIPGRRCEISRSLRLLRGLLRLNDCEKYRGCHPEHKSPSE